MAGDGSLALTGVNGSAEQRAKLEYKVAPKDILVFVPGTTDPVNSTEAQHQANAGYWEENKLLMTKVKDLRKEFLDLHVLDQFFSWSGDNAKAEREKAGNRLRELLYARKSPAAVYAGWVDKPVWLHLIGHSHGGNVINEFTKKIKAAGDFPKKWQIKSVTYLSTPFFQKLHQLDTTHFHPECRVLNVYNAYDLTQRVIADFTMRQLPAIIDRIKACSAVDTFKRGKDNFTAVMDGLLTVSAIDDTTEGPRIWRNAIAGLVTVQDGLDGVKTFIKELAKDFPDVMVAKPTSILLGFVDGLIAWVTGAITRFRARMAAPVSKWTDHYNTNKFLHDANLGVLFATLNGFLTFNRATLTGSLFDMLDGILLGRIDVVDDTTNTPKAQVPSKFTIHDLPVKKYDKYFEQRERQFSRFITRAEALQLQYVASGSQRIRMDLILLFLAQFEYLAPLQAAIDKLDNLDYLINDDRAVQLQALVATLTAYRDELNARRCDIVVPADLSQPLKEQRGGVVYLAWVAHSVSRQDLYPEVRDALIPAFGSGKNPAYKVSVKK
jgi:hypothetical protein